MVASYKNQFEHKDPYIKDGLVFETYDFRKSTRVIQLPRSFSNMGTVELVGTAFHQSNDTMFCTINTNPWTVGIWERPTHLTSRIGNGEYSTIGLENTIIDNIWHFEIAYNFINDGQSVCSRHFKNGNFLKQQTSTFPEAINNTKVIKSIGGDGLIIGFFTVIRVYDRVLSDEEIMFNHTWNVKNGRII